MPPNLDSFRSADLPRRRLPEYHSIPDEAMERIIAEAEKLPPDLYRCHILLRELGLRTSEALAARVDWVDKQRGEWFFHLKADEFFTGKNDRALRRLPIAADIAAVLMASPGPHIVEADSETDRIDLVKRRHVSWLRAHIPDIPSQFANIRRPNQALRRAFVDRCIVELRWDIKTTANYTRHDPKTLLDWYASGRMTAPPSRIPKP